MLLICWPSCFEAMTSILITALIQSKLFSLCRKWPS